MALYNPTTQRFEGPGSMYPAGSSGPSNTGFVGDTPYAQFSSLDDPVMQALFDQIQRSIPQVTQPKRGAQDFINQGMSSPLLRAILESILMQLMPGEAKARQQLTDSGEVR